MPVAVLLLDAAILSDINISERHATPEEVSQAVTQLRPEELIRLRKRAALQILGTEYTDPMELVGVAVMRAMIATSPDKREDERGRPWPIDRVVFAAFLAKSIDSIADTSRKALARTVVDHLDEKADQDGDVGTALHGKGHSHASTLDCLIEAEEICARQAKAKADTEVIEKIFIGDEAVLAVIEGDKEDMSASEVRALFGLDEKTYDSARRRLRRNVDKLMPGRNQR